MNGHGPSPFEGRAAPGHLCDNGGAVARG